MVLRLLIGVIMATIATAVTAQPLKRDPQLRMGRLDNGLTYYIYPNQTPRGEAVYRLFVKSGSVNERDDQQGLAHFLEHLAFNGTEHFPADGIIRFLESKGAKFGKDLNAHTSFNETVYKLQLPTTDPMLVDTTLTILADWAGGLTIAPEEVEKERGVIMSEWLSRGGTKTDNSMRLVMELLNGSIYSKRITIGDTAIIRHCSPQVIRDYYEQWYRPELMAVAVAGDVDVKQVEQLIRKKFSGLRNQSNPSTQSNPITPTIPEYTSEEADIATFPGATKIELDILMLLPLPHEVETADDYRQYLQRSLINSLMKLRMNSLSFDDPAYDKGTIQYSRFLGTTGVTDASVELTKGKIAQGIRDFIKHQQQILRYGFTASEISRAKTSLLKSLRNKLAANKSVTSASMMEQIYADYYDGNRLISLADELKLMERYLPTMDSVSLLNTLKETFETRPQHYLLRGGEEVKYEISNEADLTMLIDESRRQPVGRYWKDINVPDDLPRLKPANHIVSEHAIPEINGTDIRLDNGTRVIFRRSDTEHDRLTLSGFRKGGQYSLDSTRYFTSLVGPSVISLSGAGNLSREELSYFLSGNTASVRLLVDKLRTGVAGSAHLADMETMFQLLHLRWTQPRLDTTICRMTLDKLREGYRNRTDTPKDQFSRELSWLMNGRNYTNGELTDTLIDNAIQPGDMLLQHNQFFGLASGYTFVISGDCDLAEVRPLISTYIGGLPAGDNDTTWVVNTRTIPQHDVELIRRTNNDKKAMVTLVSQQDIPVGDSQTADIKANALKTILRTALLKRLREEMGKVYTVSTSVAAGQYPSYLSRATVAFVCQPADVDTLINAVGLELQQLYDSPDSYSAILDDVKQNLLKDHTMQLQQTSYWTSWIRNSIYNNQEDWTWMNRYSDEVQKLTMQDVADYAAHVIRDGHKVKAVLLPVDSALVASAVLATPYSVSGTVFYDRNNNGLFDAGDKPLKNIPVCNGDTIVVTDKNGQYRFRYSQGNSVFPVLPADYTISGSRLVNSNFYFYEEGQPFSDCSAVNFALTKKPVNRQFRLNAIGDVQVSNYQELEYATRSLWPELLVPDDKPTVNLFLGDLVNNNLKLYRDMRALMEQLPGQTWTVLGNHDRDVDTIRWRQCRTYNSVFGADMYAFNEGRVHFIVLNNVYGDGARGYRGLLSEEQLNFVRQDLKYVPKGSLIVLSMHIPLAVTKNRKELISLLEGRGDVLAVTGHMHQVCRFFHKGNGVSIHELTAGAACGFWWVGERDTDGVPSALQQEGTPRNYFVLDFNDNSYTMRCKAIDKDEHHQMTIHVAGADTLDHHLRDLQDVPDGLLMLTVYGGSDSTTVRCRIDGGEWTVCNKQKLMDPNVARIRELNLDRSYPTRYNRMNPLRHRNSHQLWTLQLPDSCRQGAHSVEVEATDRWGFRAVGRRSFCFPPVNK